MSESLICRLCYNTCSPESLNAIILKDVYAEVTKFSLREDDFATKFCPSCVDKLLTCLYVLQQAAYAEMKDWDAIFAKVEMEEQPQQNDQEVQEVQALENLQVKPDIPAFISEAASGRGSVEQEDLVCFVYNKTFKSVKGLGTHMKRVHPTEDPVSCDFCGKICKLKKYLKAYMKSIQVNDSFFLLALSFE